MRYSTEFQKVAASLCEAGRFIDSKGWVPATSGNFSARLADGTMAITTTGKHKGGLEVEDIMLADAEGNSLDGKVPSAETVLHTSIYSRFPDVAAILHPHSVNSLIISRLYERECVLANYELLKAFDGIDTHEASITIPIFANDQNIPRLSGVIDRHLDRVRECRGYIIAGHGLYTWGASVADALRHLEALDYLFDCEIRLRGLA